MFRPCIDLHEGQVKQIVGGSLTGDASTLRTNFVSTRSSSWFAELYKKDGLVGGHVIMLGPGNEEAALEALGTFPGGFHLGGGINHENAIHYLDAGASHVIVTSYVFKNGEIHWDRLRELTSLVGKSRLVLDLSCRKKGDQYLVVTDRWEKFTTYVISAKALEELGRYCSEFLVHAADVEGLCKGIDTELLTKLADWTPIPLTYAGGANSLADLETVTRLGKGKVDLTIGSALDIFGGQGVRYQDVVDFNRKYSRDAGGGGGK
ncbi:MAG: Phosphoribosylformimino-5-aminoimidazole carboxamide ribotide isomerase [Verrucomicrobiales bacterium]|nr:Phosphoribosylformimino-5-aminoimidazole carboxamide ribotide isomerase [Verrucomicrobiales bacterium]